MGQYSKVATAGPTTAIPSTARRGPLRPDPAHTEARENHAELHRLIQVELERLGHTEPREPVRVDIGFVSRTAHEMSNTVVGE